MILVAGATGELGRIVVHKLLARGERVRILVRPGSAYQDLVASGAEAAFGDLKEPDSLAPAARGAQTVITTANSKLRGGADTPLSVDHHGNKALIDAARAAGVRQFIFVSAGSADPHSRSEFSREKAWAEAYLQASGLTYTIFRPNRIMETWLPILAGEAIREGRPVPVVSGPGKHAFIARDDVAELLVAAIGHTAALNATLFPGGPRELTWREVVAACEQALGRHVEVIEVQPGQPVPGFPREMWPRLADVVAAMPRADDPALAAIFGVTLTTLEEVVRRAPELCAV